MKLYMAGVVVGVLFVQIVLHDHVVAFALWSAQRLWP